jgi:cell division protease FtsH
MEYRLLDRCPPAVAEFAELLADGENRRAGALQRVREGAGRGARGRSAGVGSYGDRAPEVAGQPGQDDDRGNEVEPDLADRLSKYDVPYARVLESTWLRDVLSWILPAVSFFGVWFFLFRRFAEKQGMGGFLNIGKSRAKVFVEKNTGVTFADVAGDEAKAELVAIVDFLKNPQDYGRLGARIPKGVLLVGPPGTGKTLLAKAVAGEAAVPFFSISGSEFVEMFVGVGAAPHAQARSLDESEQTLNQLLTEMDGFDSSVGLIILAATNRPEILDQALLRAGRFDRQVLVDRPDKKGRLDILKVHVKKVTLAQDVDLEQVAALTTGFSGADLANLVNEAALAATERRRPPWNCRTSPRHRAHRGGPGKEEPRAQSQGAGNRGLSRDGPCAGGAGAARHRPGTQDLDHPARHRRAGLHLQRPTEDRFLMTRTDLEHKIAVLLGGRAAEKLVFGELSTGAADDLARATDIARDMITRFGMDEGLGYIAFEAQRPRFLDTPELAHGGCRVAESTQARIDQAIRDIVMGVFERAYRISTPTARCWSVVRANCWRGKRSTKRYPSIDSRTCSELKTVVGAIQSKPAALFGASSNSPALFKENRYVCIDSVGPLPGTG